MNKKTTAIIASAIIILATGVGLWKWEKIRLFKLQHMAIQSNVQTQRENIASKEIDEQKILALLPKEALLYELEKNGFSQDRILYSVNAYILLDAENRLKTAGFSNQDLQKYAGCWIINLHDNKAYRIATASGQDYNFYQWVGNDKIELIGDGKKTATTYNALTGDIISTRTFNLDVSVDISNWKTYQNSEENFEIKYPVGIVIQEKHENFVDDIINRYVSFYDPKTDATIYLGVKQKSEDKIMPRPFRTGMDGGDLLSRGEVAFGNGLAQELRLVTCDFQGGNHCAVGLMWFCGLGEFGGNDFDLDSNTSAFMEVDLTEKSNVEDVTKLVHGMIRSFRTL